MQLVDDDGRLLDAVYAVEPDEPPLAAVIVDSRGGGSGPRPPRNPDYSCTLAVLLGQLNAALVDALVDSRRTRQLALPEADRRLIARPIRLAAEADVDGLRRRISAAQARTFALLAAWMPTRRSWGC